ncbi:UDP-N-acetylglucosamine 2-epimerase (non-hydrolysing) [Jatrophihabitans endophyticus]|uniref:UDP-N-acetylglucosamine 2-epimerase (Non-hydrolysing) n=1 Tax=Jatrophihabitans endophyticus TaxID=1206085 RepID=A0A1M5SWH3_9ACTN|nr:UDP-N-acetylglucosamine 2-epimerase (non-hydrolyzing) [Jatrophihabitans endophyticus]SHH42849.1 UDP-N-acetylglucosamine 2-epimerase (non-hydrolysing) [Jatrophihabitans endophyticus]
MTGRIALVLGTRPEIIKLAPVARHLGARATSVWTGQHYDRALVDDIVAGCELPFPHVRLTGVGGRDRGRQMARMLTQLDRELRALAPAAVLVQGDTNSASAGAQAAHYLGIPVVHVEAGLRSYDRAMPEEINRSVISALADVHCCPTADNAANLVRAGVPMDAVHVTGNTIVEATLTALPDVRRRREIVRDLGLDDGGYVLTTLHRPENTDDPDRLRTIMTQLGALAVPVALPLHPRTAARLREHGVPMPDSVRPLPPLDHATFLSLAAQAALLVADSGGLQEEATVLGRPMVVVRRSTERPEAVAAGFAELTSPAGIGTAARRMLGPEVGARLAQQPSPFGDGHAGRRIADLALVAAGVAPSPSSGGAQRPLQVRHGGDGEVAHHPPAHVGGGTA